VPANDHFVLGQLSRLGGCGKSLHDRADHPLLVLRHLGLFRNVDDQLSGENESSFKFDVTASPKR
jgi:hypothetical protein